MKRGLRRGDEVHQDVQGESRELCKRLGVEGAEQGSRKKGRGQRLGKGRGRRMETFPVGQP